MSTHPPVQPDEALQTALADFTQAYARFFELLETVPDRLQSQPGACGHWSPHDIVAHLSGWVIEAQRRYRRFPRGTGQVVYNIDVFNQMSVRTRRGKPWGALVEELRRAVRTLTEKAQQLSPDQIARDDRYAEWLGIMAQDVQQHGHQLRDFIAGHSESAR